MYRALEETPVISSRRHRLRRLLVILRSPSYSIEVFLEGRWLARPSSIFVKAVGGSGNKDYLQSSEAARDTWSISLLSYSSAVSESNMTILHSNDASMATQSELDVTDCSCRRLVQIITIIIKTLMILHLI